MKHLVLTDFSPSSANIDDHVAPTSSWHAISSSTTSVRADLAVLSTTLDTLITILIQIGEVLPQFLVGSMNDVSILNRSELGCQSTDGGNMKFVLM
jgi:hypothetical protein